jgi:hypothetical protein
MYIFKIGDKVVRPLPYLWVGTVILIKDDSVGVDFGDKGNKWAMKAYELIPEEIFNSPLYKALNESEDQATREEND